MPVEGTVKFRDAPSDFASFAEPVETSAPKDFASFAEPVGWSDTAADIGKSFVAGVGKGVAGLVGLPDQVAEWGARGIDWASRKVGDAIGVDVPAREAREPKYGPAAVQQAMETVTGKFHEPETTPGHYAETVGEFVPAAVGGPAGIGRRLVAQAVVPGIASEAAGQATKGTAYETPARVAAGLVTGGVGAALTAPRTAEQIIRGELADAGVTQQHVADARRMIQEAQTRGVNLSWPEALSQAAGRPVLTKTMHTVEGSPETRAAMQRFFGERPQQVDQAALNSFQPIAPGTANPSTLGREVSEAAGEHLNDVRQTINRAAEPHYQAAENVFLTPAEMQQVRQIPGFDHALEAVRNGPNAWRIQHLPDNNVGVLNAIKKHFDELAENAGSQFNPMRSQETRATREMQASAVRQVGELLSPDYQTALEIGRRGRQQFLQPLLDGPLGRIADRPDTKKAIEALFPSNPLPNSHNEVYDAVSALARRNPGAARQLVRAHLERTFNEATRSLQSGENQFGAASFAKALVGNPQQRENLRAAVEALPNGQQLWDGFNRFLEIAEATRYRKSIGSETAFNQAGRKALTGSGMGRELVKTGASPGKWWNIVSDKLDKWSVGQNLNELARIFTDPRSADLLARIARMPSTGDQAGAAVARLILTAQESLSKTSGPSEGVGNQGRGQPSARNGR